MSNIIFWLGLSLSIISGAYKYLLNSTNSIENNTEINTEKNNE